MRCTRRPMDAKLACAYAVYVSNKIQIGPVWRSAMSSLPMVLSGWNWLVFREPEGAFAEWHGCARIDAQLHKYGDQVSCLTEQG